MMNSFLSDFKTIIRECDYSNTYKMAWAKSIVEISTLSKDTSNTVKISLEDIATKAFKYYWNMTIFFDLIQGNSTPKHPVIITIIKELIEEYQKLMNINVPIVFERVEHNFPRHLLDNAIKKIVKVLKQDVSWRFLNLNKKNYSNIYSYEKNADHLFMKLEDVNSLKENEQDLYDLINYRWALILESFNSSPRINRKVKIIDEREIKRKPLTRFRAYLDLENPNRICFECQKTITDDLSIDHVIPWSYLYSDDIWNLVYLCRSCNSSKSNITPTEQMIEKLKTRNQILYDKMIVKDKKDKIFEELQLAINKDYVTKFWISSKN